MSKPLPSPFPDMDDPGHSEQTAKPGSGVPGFVFLSQPPGDSMRPSIRYYKAPTSHAANRGHQQFPPHPARFGNGNGYRGSDGNRSPFQNSRGRGRGNNANGGNSSSYGNVHQGDSNRGNSYFQGSSSPIGNTSSYGNNSFHSPRGNMSPSSYNSPRGNMSPSNYNSPRGNMSPSSYNSPRGNMSPSNYNSPRGNSSPFGYSSPGAGNFQSGPNSSPAHPPSLGGNSSFGSPSTPNSSFQSSPFSASGGRGNRGRGGRGQNSSFSGSNRRGGRGGRNTPLSEVPAEKFMSDGILQNPWDRLINSLDPEQKKVFLAEEEHDDAIGVDSPCISAPSDPSSRLLNSSDDVTGTSSSAVPGSSIEESNDMFVDSWQ